MNAKTNNMQYFHNPFPDWTAGSSAQVDEKIVTGLIDEYLKGIQQGMPPTLQHCDGGLYVGIAGVTSMFAKLSSNTALQKSSQQYLDRAISYLEVSLEYCQSQQSRDPPYSFLLGSAGVWMLGAMVYSRTGNKQQEEACLRHFLSQSAPMTPVDYSRTGGDELFVGRAGWLVGAVALNRVYGREVVSSEVQHKLCDAIVESGRQFSRRHRSPSPLMFAYHGTQYLGAAHGLSAILQVLLSVPGYLSRRDGATRDVRAALDWLVSVQTDEGNFPVTAEEVARPRRAERGELVHWCHGAPGVVYLLALAYRTWGDERYLSACVKCATLTWERGLLRKGPGLCHGVAGSGYVFLLLYRLTGDKKYLHRANCFAHFLTSEEFRREARTPDSPYSLYEGTAGTVCFLADLLQPDRAHFPYFDVLA